MNAKIQFVSAKALVGLVFLFALMSSCNGQDADPPDAVPPNFVVNPYWPKELPNRWRIGQIGGLAVDKDDHVWVLQRPRSLTPDELLANTDPPGALCCVETPAVIEFDSAGNVLRAWGGPGHVPQWPQQEHGIWVDDSDNVWLGGNGANDRQVLKFAPDGELLMVIGSSSNAAKNNQDTGLLGAPAAIVVDDANHEVYIADGYLNNRVIVFNSDTGEFKRGWGAYGIGLEQIDNTVNSNPEGPAEPIPNSRQFGNPVHCIRLSDDELVYVCDRSNNRIQVFSKDGTFLQEFEVRPETRWLGSAWAIEFSDDPTQDYIFVADGTNNTVWVLRRDNGLPVAEFGHPGRNAGQFHWLHQGATDSSGNFYSGEVDSGKRVQQFVLQTDRE